MPIETWFPSVIFFEDIEIEPLVKQGVMQAVHERADPILAATGAEGVTAANAANDLHLDPRMSALFGLFGAPLKRFLFEGLRIEPLQAELYVGRCWPVVHGSGEFGGGVHIHAGAVFSGVFYLQVPEGSGSLQFCKPYRASYDSLAKTEWCDLNFQYAEYPAVEHRLMVFSANIEHRRLASKAALGAQRIAIAFDLYSMVDLEVKGGGIPRYEALRRVV